MYVELRHGAPAPWRPQRRVSFRVRVVTQRRWRSLSSLERITLEAMVASGDTVYAQDHRDEHHSSGLVLLAD